MNGQSIWTLEDCLEYAETHNIQLQKSNIEIEKQRVEVTQSNLNYIPEIAVYADRNYSWGRSVDMQELIVIKNKMNSSLALSASTSIPIIDGFKKIYSSKISRAELKLSQYEEQSLQEDVNIQIIKAYLEILLSREMLKIAQNELDEITIQIGKSKELIRMGKQPQSAILELSAKQSESEVQLIDAKWQLISKKMALEQILGLTWGSIEEIPIYDYEIIDKKEMISLDGNISKYLEGSPILNIAKEKQIIAKLNYNQSRSQLMPIIGLSLGYMTYFGSSSNEKISEQLKANINPTVGISLQIPLFRLYSTYSQVKRTKLNLSYANIERRQVQTDLQNKISNAIVDANRYYDSREAMKDGVKSSEDAYYAMQKRYETGAATAMDLIIAHNSMIKTKSNLFQLSLQYLFQLIIIDCYCGKKISL